MKKFCWILILALLLTGCGKKTEELPKEPEKPVVEAPAEKEPPKAEPFALEELTVEFLRTGADGSVLMQAVKKLPAELCEAFEASGFTVETAKVTMSGSSAATVQAVAEGGVTMAVLSVAELVQAERMPLVGAVAGERQMLLCAADTAYGKNLSTRETPTWAELDHARWGVLRQDLVGRDAVELYLADHYEGNALSDLSSVTEYETWDDLFAAAQAGKIDVFPAEQAEGFAILSEGERFYTMAAVVEDETLIPYLAQILARLQEGEFAALFGKEPYVQAQAGALDAQKRLTTLLP